MACVRRFKTGLIMAVALSQKHEFNEWTEFGPVVFEHLSDTPDVGCFQARFVYFLLFRLDPVRVLLLVARQNEHGKNYIRLVERECLFRLVISHPFLLANIHDRRWRRRD